MNTEKALFILRHGSYEGHQKYLEAVKVIEDEFNRQKETIEQLKTALFKCGEDAVEIENYKKIAEYQQSLSMDRFFEIQRLREEIERLHNILLSFTNEVSVWSNKKGYDTSEISLIPILDKAKNIKEEARAEAVKEFAERLKTGAVLDDDLLWVTDVDIDNLVKEFTEGG